MQKQFKAKTLEEAYENATSSLKCSITDLHIDIIQPPSKGFFGLFAKDAIILAKFKHHHKQSKKIQPSKYTNSKSHEKYEKQRSQEKTQQVIKKPIQTPQVQKQNKTSSGKIFDDFYSSADYKKTHDKITVKKDENLVVQEIQDKLNNLFELTCYKLDNITVKFYDEETIYVEFQGDDAALLIGKEGYRYKALSYILFNWIHEKYDLMLRLEVAQFLTTQEEAIYNYLEPVIETINEDGFYKTKPLDGVLVHIALKKLRDEFPDKYVAVKTNVKGDKYILVNEYRN